MLERVVKRQSRRTAELQRDTFEKLPEMWRAQSDREGRVKPSSEKDGIANLRSVIRLAGTPSWYTKVYEDVQSKHTGVNTHDSTYALVPIVWDASPDAFTTPRAMPSQQLNVCTSTITLELCECASQCKSRGLTGAKRISISYSVVCHGCACR
jgi:hypothetical protein